MKLVIFAGGSGRRLWPISLQSSPKQFEPIIGSRSTVQLAVDRVRDQYGVENIYISTNEKYVDILRGQLPELPPENIIGEPTRRDLAAAVGLAMSHIARSAAPDEPVGILWGDNYMTNIPAFLSILKAAEKLLVDKKAELLFIGETPRFANNNLGWLSLGTQKGEAAGQPYYGFDSLTYRPASDLCDQMFAAGTHVWNTGYFVTTAGFVTNEYSKNQPEMWAGLQEIAAQIGQPDYQSTLHRIYPTLPVFSFDDAILQYVPQEQTLVLHGELGWSDPGTLYALKEALNPDPTQNVEKGLTISTDSEDCLLYNYEEGKLLAAIGLKGMVVVNTPDAILVVHKDQIPLVKQLVNSLVGTTLEKYT